MQQRDNKIDILRFIGLSMIILAHVQSPNLIHQIRAFDVPLMLFISGLTSSKKELGPYWSYVWHRIKRLLVPVWLFLTGYFVAFYGIRLIVNKQKDVPWLNIAKSYLLLNDGEIGYVWIIRIFLLVMFVTPLLVSLEKKIQSTIKYVILCIAFLAIQSGMVFLDERTPEGLVSLVYNQYVTYIIGYSIPFMLGLRFKNTELYNKQFWLGLLLFICASVLLYIFTIGLQPIDFMNFKYPPTLYFIIYGSILSLLLWYLVSAYKSIKCNWGGWIGRNTIWIYLWHIPSLFLIRTRVDEWWLRFILIYLCAVWITYLQYRIVKRLNIPFATKYFLG